MLSMSQSFVMSGSGASIEHNMRLVKSGGIRQNGVPERRCFNEHLLVDESLDKKDYVKTLLQKKVKEVVGDKLATYNEKCIKNRHYNMVRDLQGFIDSQQREYKGKKRSCITEIVIQVGDKFTACPYVVARDEQGRMLDKGGRVIPDWDTRRIPAYADGKVVESEESKLVKKVYRRYFDEFCKKNPQFVPLSCDIHADERGGTHCHITGFFVAKTKTGLGISLSRTSAIAQMLGNNGRNTRTSNAQNQWRANMRFLLEDVCKEFDIERKDMHNKEKHRNQRQYYAYADARCEAMEQKETSLEIQADLVDSKTNALTEKEKTFADKEKMFSEKERMILKKEAELQSRERELLAREKELSGNQVKQEWLILKKNFPVLYKKINTIYKNVLDRETNSNYNNR